MIRIEVKKALYGAQGEMDLDVGLEIKEQDFIAISGESGSGKTTLLRILAGLDEAQGKIEVGGEIWLDGDYMLPVQKREIGFVFQEYALFPNMCVQENLLYVNKDKKLSQKLLEMTQLTALAKRFPDTLSGGQKQRVALCRAMMRRPKLLLMDEPFSALDPAMRLKLQDEIALLHKEFETTTILVSHEPSEIYRLSDRVLVLDRGKIVHDGRAKDILLKTTGSAKFSFEGELLDLVKIDVIYVAIISIAQQLVEVVVSEQEAKNLTIGMRVNVSTKAFNPTISQGHL